MYLFAYGSLMNPRSLAQTLSGIRIVQRETLSGYRRKANIEFDGYAYLNLVRDPGASVKGVLISITEGELSAFAKREAGYTIVDVTAFVRGVTGRVVVFIAPDKPCTHSVPRSYIDTCTSGMSEIERTRWITETEFLGIEEDNAYPVYEFAAK